MGYVVISDREEAALYQENPGQKNRNGGGYKGLKVLKMKPGDKVGFLFVPNSTVEKVFEKPKITGAKRPLFSLTTENPDDNFPENQFVDLTGDGEVFAFDGSRNGQKDYKDIVFVASRLEGEAPLYDDLINPKRDWFEEKTEFVEVVDSVIDEDRDAPEITVELANDTGEDETDKITTDPSLTGTVIDESEIVSFEISLTGESDSFVEVTSELESDGNFVLEREVLEEILGETLPEGMNTIYLRATDENGWDSAVFELEFTLEEEDLLGPEIESLAGIYGLNSYPVAVSLPPGEKRQLSVKINEWIDSPELTTDIGDISYVVGDEELLEVSPSGVITASAEGETTITVKYGDAEVSIPVLVEPPEPDSNLADELGGVVETLDGSVIMVPPGALTQETSVGLTPLEREDLSLSLPESWEFVGAFELELGDTPLEQPVQLAIPAPADLEAGAGVLFLRKGRMPDATGTWTDTWLIEEVGGVGTDGMLRTASPPYVGLVQTGEFIVVEMPSELIDISTKLGGALSPQLGSPYAPVNQPVGEYIAWLEEIQQIIKVAGSVNKFQYLGARAGLIGLIGTSYAQFLLTSVLAAYVATLEQTSLEIIGIPEVGPPVGTTTEVFLNENGLPSYSAELPGPRGGFADPLLGPALRQAELEFVEGDKPVVSLRGSNFLNDFEGEVGSQFDDLIGKFYVGDAVYEGEVVPELSRELGENEFEIAIEIPIAVPLGEADIVLSRRQEKRVGPEENDVEEIELDGEEKLRLLPTCEELILVSQRSADAISVVDMLHPMSTIEESSSADLLRAKISVGTPGVTDRPGELAATDNGTRAYVPLEFSGQVALVDLMALRQVDADAETPEVEPVPLPEGATPVAVVIDSNDEYAYVADKNGGRIYVLDVNPESDSYHETVKTIVLELNNDSAELRQMAVSADGRRLFVTASYGQIYVVNIDPDDRPKEGESNSYRWWEQIGALATATGAMGLAATSDPLKMTFTNGSSFTDGSGFGVLKITNDYPLEFEATANYLNLSLDSFRDYFDVDEGVAVAVMKDGEYAFVAGRDTRGNAGTSFYPDKREGGNIGIIKDPLGDNPRLVAATRPIPGSLTNNVSLTGDDRFLLASYPTLSGGGAVYGFDVEEIIETVESLELKASGEDGGEVYWLDDFNRGEGSVAFDEGSQREATLGDLAILPIDDINPEVSVAADYEIIGGNWVNQWVFGVPSGTNRAPIGIGGNPLGMTSVSVRDWVELVSPGDRGRGTADSLTPTFEWEFEFEDEEDTEDDCLLEVNPDEVEGVNLYVSAFPEGEGLLPKDYWDELSPGTDYNPNRVLTAKWNRANQTWTWKGGSRQAPASLESPLPERFSLPEELQLTGGQTYHWAVEVVTENGEEEVVSSQFNTALPTTDADNAFSSVTVLTGGVEPRKEATVETQKAINAIAEQLEDAGAAVINYNPKSGKWQSVNYNSNTREWSASNSEVELGKPLVLLADWIKKPDSDDAFSLAFSNAGVAEEAADGLFASLVELDLKNGGTVGGSNGLYDSNGNLIREQGAVFNAPLHFIGFGQGAVVNTEIIQRLGTYFPEAGGLQDSGVRDLMMTTVDPFEYNPESAPQFNGTFSRMLDPEIVVWDNVTYADNYYQVQGKEGDNTVLIGQELKKIPNRQGAPGKPDRADMNYELKDWAGFDRAQATDNAHRAAVAWYGGTANLNESQIPAGQQKVFRRLGDLEDLNDPQKSWFVPGHTKSSFNHGDTNAPWEGIGTGWFYSVNGGGSELRPYFVDGDPNNKKSKDELGNFEDYLKNNRRPVTYDNTYTKGIVNKRLRGDYATPTVFNGNFELVTPKNDPNDPLPNVLIPGWSYNGASAANSVNMSSLVDWRTITSFDSERSKLGFEGTQLNYTLNLDRNNNQIVHNPQVVPDWGLLRLDVHAPGTTDEVRGELVVTLKPLDDSINSHDQRIALQKASNTLTNGIPSSYEEDKYKIDYGRKGFESFFIPVPDRLRGQMVSIDLQLRAAGSKRPTVYLDNVFFQSNTLRFGNPTDARNNSSANYQNNYLIEKPQYTISFNKARNTPNWVSSVFDGSWSSGNLTRPQGFAEDSDLDGTGWYKVKQNDYKFESQIQQYYSKGQYDDFVKRKKAFFWSDRGHLSAAKDRSRSQKDMNATFLTTNIFPQDQKLNRGMWANLEAYLRNQFQTYQHKLYVISGVKGTGGGGGKEDWNIFKEFDAATNPAEKIQVPDRFWKVIMGFNKESPSEYPDYAFAVYIPNNTKETHEIDYNRVPAVGQARKWYDEKPNGEPYFIKSIWGLEQILNGDLAQRGESFRYDFLSNVTDPVIKENIKKYKQPFPSI